MIVYYSEYSVFVVGDYVPKWLPKWASQLKTIMSDLRLRNGNFPFRNRKGCELGLYSTILGKVHAKIELLTRENALKCKKGTILIFKNNL